jgi:hypothetical protein
MSQFKFCLSGSETMPMRTAQQSMIDSQTMCWVSWAWKDLPLPDHHWCLARASHGNTHFLSQECFVVSQWTYTRNKVILTMSALSYSLQHDWLHVLENSVYVTGYNYVSAKRQTGRRMSRHPSHVFQKSINIYFIELGVELYWPEIEMIGVGQLGRYWWEDTKLKLDVKNNFKGLRYSFGTITHNPLHSWKHAELKLSVL